MLWTIGYRHFFLRGEDGIQNVGTSANTAGTAVFSEDDTTAQDCKPMRLVLTDRSHARINLKTGACTMILFYSEESESSHPQSTLCIVVSSNLGGIKYYQQVLQVFGERPMDAPPVSAVSGLNIVIWTLEYCGNDPVDHILPRYIIPCL